MVNLFFFLKKYFFSVFKVLKGFFVFIEDYTVEFGFLGSMFYIAVGRERKLLGN